MSAAICADRSAADIAPYVTEERDPVSRPLDDWCCAPGSTCGSLRDLHACQRTANPLVPQGCNTVCRRSDPHHGSSSSSRCAEVGWTKSATSTNRVQHPEPAEAGFWCCKSRKSAASEVDRLFTCSLGAGEGQMHHRLAISPTMPAALPTRGLRGGRAR